jgi:Ca2+-binding RTX toxin-like protein
MSPRATACAALACATAASLAAGPGAASAHSLVRPAGAVVSYISADATSLNTLVVRASGSRIEFRDPTVDGGMDPGSCAPGDVTADTNVWIIQTFCPAAGVTSLRLDLGEREDTATVSVNIATTMLGGPGADTLTGGPADDQVSGDDGDDVLTGGGGADVVIGGLGIDEVSADAGDDDVRVRDGIQDVVRCGDGSDRVDADTLDEVAGDCEAVTRTLTPAPPGTSTTRDRVAPQLQVGAATRQRIGRSRRLRVFASSSEMGFVAASGALRIDGLGLPLSVARRPIAVAGGGAALAVTLTQAQWRQALRALRRRRAVSVQLTVVATDRAGNSRAAKPVRIRLVR